jgi:putative tryptophan/tyrosine transport system substrate-binding protein
MRRREFITLLGGAAAWPLAARAQQAGLPVIGYLSARSPDVDTPFTAAFRKGLSETGYVEGRNVAIEYRWADGEYDRLLVLAADLVRRQVVVIAAAGGSSPALAAKAATTRIPIVFQTGDNPVEVGLVASLNRPGSNLTGVTSLNAEVVQKRLELLHELFPTATIMALLVNSTNPNAEVLSRDAQAGARTLGLELHVMHATTERDFDMVFADLLRLGASGLVIGSDPFFAGRSEQLAALSVRHAVPTIFQYHQFAAAGGLMSYGGDLTDTYRQVGVYAGRILKGERPADLPVQQSTKVELIINLKTAKAFGITVPITLLGRADEIIE